MNIYWWAWPLLVVGVIINAYIWAEAWKAFRDAHPGKALLRRIARRCEIHDAPAPGTIRQLESELGMEQSPASGNFVGDHANPRLIDCGHDWCRIRSGR